MKNDQEILIRSNEDPAVKRILSDMSELFEEIQIENTSFRVPAEMRPQENTGLTMSEAADLIEASLIMVYDQLTMLVDKLAKIDPDFFAMRLEQFFREWEEQHQDFDKRFFWLLKFKLECYLMRWSTFFQP